MNQITNSPKLTIIHLLFSFAQADHPVSERILARLLMVPSSRVHQLLRDLDEMGLVNAEHLRLTMQGLVVAASTRDRFSSPAVHGHMENAA